MSAGAKAANFHDLWQRYAPDVYRFALYLSGDHSTAEDLTSEAFLRAWSVRDRVDTLTVKSYLLSIARNLYLHQIRKAGRETSTGYGPLEALPALGSPVREAEEREELRLVLGGIRELPEIDRAALLLRCHHGLGYEEIAAMLGLPVSTVRVKVYRARLRLSVLCQRNPV